MAAGSIFSVEEEIISDIEALTAKPGGGEPELRQGLNQLLAAYKRLYKEEKNLIRVNDRQQNQMNRLNRELKKAKDIAEAASRSKGAFLASMSHEIRTPMNAIIGLTELCLRTELSLRQQDYLSKIESSANSLLGIINDILDFSKIEVGKLELEFIDFDLNQVLENLTNLIAVKAEEKNLELLFNVDPAIPTALKGDPLRLGQILVNLTSNAVKFTEKGEILVKVEFSEAPEVAPDQVTLKFSIQDTGIGLSPEQMGRLFQSFSQADQSTTRKYGGTGLGLDISKSLAAMMGGDIWVASEAGIGSTFSFTARFGVQTGTAKINGRLIQSMEGLKILVVDDNPKSREILDAMLSPYTTVYQAASAHESFSDLLSADKEKPFDIILMDWKMPVMDGLEAIAHIRGRMDLRHQPIIFLVTAYGREEIRQQVKELDIDGFLIKPVTSTLLFSKINSVIGDETENMPIKAVSKPSDAKVHEDIRGARILLVEDNEINQQVACELLTQAGLAVTVADSGHGALDRIQKDRFDLIFMDVQMPDMDGYQTTRVIRKLEADLKSAVMASEDVSPFTLFPAPRIPIVAMTANAIVGDREKCLAAGMNDYLTKPISLGALSAVLKEWIKPGERKDSEPPDRAASPGPGDDLLPARIAGIDIRGGLRNVGGNKALYRKILVKFYLHNRNRVEELQAALDREDYPGLIHQAHTIKGVAGNIGAGDLYRTSAALELSLKKEETGQAQLLLNMMAHKLNEVLEALALFSQQPVEGMAPRNIGT